MAILNGCSVLLVEDEPLIALDVQECLQQEGAQVYWAADIGKAIDLADHADLSAAVIDYELNGANGETVCQRLSDRNIPFLFYSGCDADQLGELGEIAPVLTKPVPCDEIAAALRQLIRQRQPPPARSEHAV